MQVIGKDPGDDRVASIAQEAGDDLTEVSLRERLLDWATAIVVALGVVASIPMIPILVFGLVVLVFRSPTGVRGFRIIGATFGAAERGTSSKLEGFNATLLFPMVVAGWFLIALVAAVLVAGDPARPGSGAPALGFALFVGLFIGPTFLVYRSMHAGGRQGSAR